MFLSVFTGGMGRRWQAMCRRPVEEQEGILEEGPLEEGPLEEGPLEEGPLERRQETLALDFSSCLLRTPAAGYQER
jgi:hypothetical protein